MKHFLIAALALLPAALALAGAAQPLGRLFNTPGERAAIERLRLKNPGADTAERNPASPQSDDAGLPDNRVTVNGVVRRSNGKSVVWINEVPRSLPTDTAATQAGKSKGAGVSVELGTGKAVRLKPGQTFHPVTGKISDVESAASP